MEIISIILNWLPFAVSVIVIAAGSFGIAKRSVKSLREWLVLAVAEAEKALGSGTGALKLRMVWESANSVMPLLMKFIPFETFSRLVDEALADVRRLLEVSRETETYIKEDGK